jgi:hypothetical protein
LCTSSPVPEGFAHWRYYVAGADGKRRSLSAAGLAHQQIHSQGDGFNVADPPCRYDADAFFYGPLSELRGDAAEVIREHRPECRSRRAGE